MGLELGITTENTPFLNQMANLLFQGNDIAVDPKKC
jgi:hypothetical protein